MILTCMGSSCSITVKGGAGGGYSPPQLCTKGQIVSDQNTLIKQSFILIEQSILMHLIFASSTSVYYCTSYSATCLAACSH